MRRNTIYFEAPKARGVGLLLAGVVVFESSPALACDACSPADIRALAILTAIGLGGWILIRIGRWAGRRFSQARSLKKEV